MTADVMPFGIMHQQWATDSVSDAQQMRERIEEIVNRLYAGLNPALRPAAGRSVLAHLIDLSGRGIVAADGLPTVGAHYRLRHTGRQG